MKNLHTFLFFILLPLGLVSGQVRTGDHVTVTEPQQANAYLVGGTVSVQAATERDLTVIGGEVDLQDNLAQDGLIIGGEVRQEGRCQEDLRILGGEVTLREPVAGDLVVVGGEVQLEAGAEVGGRVLIVGGSVDLSAATSGDVQIMGGEVRIHAPVYGNLEASGGSVVINATVHGQSKLRSRELTLGPNALFKSNVRYWQKKGEIDFDPYLESGARSTWDPELANEIIHLNWEKIVDDGLFWLRLIQVISGLTLLFVLYLIMRRFFERRTGNGRKLFVPAFVYGLAAAIGFPLASIVAFSSVIGIPLGIIALSLTIIGLVIAHALAALFLAYEWGQKDWSGWTLLGVAGSIFLVMRLLALVPFVGSGINGLLSVWAIGYLLLLLWRHNHPNLPEEGTRTANGGDMV